MDADRGVPIGRRLTFLGRDADGLVLAGLATVVSETKMVGRGLTIKVELIRIIDAGRRALEGRPSADRRPVRQKPMSGLSAQERADAGRRWIPACGCRVCASRGSGPSAGFAEVSSAKPGASCPLSFLPRPAGIALPSENVEDDVSGVDA